MNILAITTMFPNKNEPFFGIFVKRRLEALSKLVNLTIVSPQPYFPFLSLLKHYRNRRDIPRKTKLNDNTTVYYPRFLSFPVILKPLDGPFLAIILYFFIRKLKKKGVEIDLLDAHLAYPEGTACNFLRKIFKVPVTLTLRGHDIHYLPKYPIRKRQVITALKKVDKAFSVSNALRLGAGELGCDINKIVVATNGVQSDLFYPVNKQEIRKKLDIPVDKKIILTIGYLVPCKGFDLLIDALHLLHTKEKMTDVMLIILGGRGGDTYIKHELVEQIEKYGLQDSVRFEPPKQNEELYEWYNLADVFCLASSREGWPNVILEALACEVPVVASNVWGIPEIFGNDTNIGLLVERTPELMAQGLKKALNKKWDKTYIRKFAEARTWDKTAQLLKKEMAQLIKNTGA